MPRGRQPVLHDLFELRRSHSGVSCSSSLASGLSLPWPQMQSCHPRVCPETAVGSAIRDASAQELLPGPQRTQIAYRAAVPPTGFRRCQRWQSVWRREQNPGRPVEWCAPRNPELPSLPAFRSTREAHPAPDMPSPRAVPERRFAHRICELTPPQVSVSLMRSMMLQSAMALLFSFHG